ncbi:MAG: hypothetical protein WBM54_06685 [Woeseia sp.]
MNVFTFLFLAILTGGVVHVLDSWIKHRRAKPDALDAEIAEALEKIERLEERIKVLERIVTEHHVDLKQQIDSL